MRKIFVLLMALLLCTGCSFGAKPPVDVGDYDALYNDYLFAPVYSGIAITSWSDPTEVNPDHYINYYAYTLGTDSELDFYEDGFEPEDLEAFVTSHFDVTPEFLKTSTQYDADRGVYFCEVLGGAAGVKVAGAQLNGSTMLLDYNIISADGSESVIWGGTFTIEFAKDGSFKYTANLVKN